ncbi:VOC family protein [Bradyrhizobium xenonodulans]|uniref:VOC family protein n=1 Tax=Bradyrhizobium xenonodulans TaxID=2736875 RepID=A0ABY7ME33_9BRAD|nr:VOC family protein [Bradyrhizobium xenonodulans]WBL76641.1 VOC family protein [Bradyrhizobium xenonodulans]
MSDFPVTALRSVEITTPQLAGSVEFYSKVWGLDVAAESGGTAYLAATGSDFHVLELTAGEATSLRKVSFRVRSQEDLHRLFARARQAGCEVISSPGPSPAPSGGESFLVREPQGCAMEFVHGDRTKAARVIAERPERLAHVNINSADVERLSAFYQEVLGFRLSDRSKLMAFLCCNSDHHAIVVADAPRNGLNHIAFLMPDLESVMRGSGRMVDHGYPIGWGVGRHGPGDNVFAYFVDPAGIVIEYTAEVLQIDDSYVAKGPGDWVWPPGRTDQWGIAPPKSDACKKAQVAVPFAKART